MSRNTIARVDLAAVRHNLVRTRQLARSSELACVVKADAYGHGLNNILSELNDADILAVATVGEAEECRSGGWNGRLLHLQGPSNSAEFEQLRGMGAEMVVHHDSQIPLLESRAGRFSNRLWLKIDSGMHRLGFAPGDVRGAFQQLESLRGPEPTVLMTHFACADEPDNPLTRNQVERFDEAIAGLPGPVSMANSAAILNYPDCHRDIVRPGILLYGVSACADRSAASLDLLPAMTLQCDLIAINQCQRGESVGYGAAWVCPEDMAVGVAAIGYGDGYPRHAGNGTPVLLGGRKAPLVGHVSMDMICLDLRQHPQARVGDVVTLWGAGLPVEEVAQWAGVLPYELICGVTARVKTEVLGPVSEINERPRGAQLNRRYR